MFSIKEMTKDIFPCSIHRVTHVHWYSKRKRRAQVVCTHKNSLKCAVPFPTKLLDKPRLLALVWSQPAFNEEEWDEGSRDQLFGPGQTVVQSSSAT